MLFGWILLRWPHPELSVDVADQSVEMLFEAVAEPPPKIVPPAAAMPDLLPDPIAPDPEPSAKADSELVSLTPAPEPVESPTSVVPTPVVSPAPIRSLPPKSVPSRPPRPMPAVATLPIPNAPTSRSTPPPAAAAASPASAVPASAAPASPAAADPGWRVALSGWLAAHKRYPDQARRRDDEGTVGVRFTVDAAGRVPDVAVIRSSGSALLDDAAREMLSGQRVPPFPPSMTLAQITVPVNIRYQLEQ